jgi:hypothetical protein
MLFILRLLGFNVLLNQINEIGDKTMTAISDFAAKQEEYNQKIEAAVSGLSEDIKFLSDKITEIQNSPGVISPTDQSLLDQLDARAQALVVKLEALNELTPPQASNGSPKPDNTLPEPEPSEPEPTEEE